jgi:hypothetical protein
LKELVLDQLKLNGIWEVILVLWAKTVLPLLKMQKYLYVWKGTRTRFGEKNFFKIILKALLKICKVNVTAHHGGDTPYVTPNDSVWH